MSDFALDLALVGTKKALLKKRMFGSVPSGNLSCKMLGWIRFSIDPSYMVSPIIIAVPKSIHVTFELPRRYCIKVCLLSNSPDSDITKNRNTRKADTRYDLRQNIVSVNMISLKSFTNPILIINQTMIRNWMNSSGPAVSIEVFKIVTRYLWINSWRHVSYIVL